MKVILVDDEPLALETLEHILSKYEDIEVLGSYTNPNVALEKIKELQPDVLFLDIEMGSINGLEMAQLFAEEKFSIEIVFITAYSKYAVEAFEINALDYLLKPIQEKRLYKTIKRLEETIENKHGVEVDTDGFDNRLTIKSFGNFEVVDKSNNPLIWRTQKTKELFAYLWCQKGRPISKSLIMENIFPNRDIDKATTILHTTVYQLRKNLERLGFAKGIVYFNESYQLNVPIISDLGELNRIIDTKTLNEEDIKKILNIYKGDFLEEEGYNWVMGVQQIYKDMVLNILADFAKSQLELGRLDEFLRICLEAMINMDPYNEDIARLIIQYYGIQRNKASLEKFYNEYVKNLWLDLNLRPSESTREVYNIYIKKTE